MPWRGTGTCVGWEGEISDGSGGGRHLADGPTTARTTKRDSRIAGKRTCASRRVGRSTCRRARVQYGPSVVRSRVDECEWATSWLWQGTERTDFCIFGQFDGLIVVHHAPRRGFFLKNPELRLQVGVSSREMMMVPICHQTPSAVPTVIRHARPSDGAPPHPAGPPSPRTTSNFISTCVTSRWLFTT